MGQSSKESKQKYHRSERGRAMRKAHYLSKKEFYQQYERNRQYQKMYGITVADYDSMLSAQEGKCKVCKSDKPGGKAKYFVVDHCHATGRIRGLLCYGCNVGIGFYEKLHNVISNYLQDS